MSIVLDQAAIQRLVAYALVHQGTFPNGASVKCSWSFDVDKLRAEDPAGVELRIVEHKPA